MHNRLLVLLDEAQDEVYQDLQDFLGSLGDLSLREVVPEVGIKTGLLLDADLVSFVHDHEQVCEVEVIRLVHRCDAVHYLLLDAVQSSLLTRLSLGEDRDVEGVATAATRGSLAKGVGGVDSRGVGRGNALGEGFVQENADFQDVRISIVPVESLKVLDRGARCWEILNVHV